MTCGFDLVKNRSHMWKSNDIKKIRFVCARYRKLRGNTRSMDNSEYNFCHHDFHKNQNYSWDKEGIHCQRRTWTKRSITLKHTCPFYLYIAFDSQHTHHC